MNTNNLVELDGVYYDVKLTAIRREVTILDGPASGRSDVGSMIFDTLGTYYSHTVTFVQNNENLAAYDALHAALRSPKSRKHMLRAPFGQGSVSYIVYVSSISDAVVKCTDNTYWDGMEVKCTAVDPNEVP